MDRGSWPSGIEQLTDEHIRGKLDLGGGSTAGPPFCLWRACASALLACRNRIFCLCQIPPRVGPVVLRSQRTRRSGQT